MIFEVTDNMVEPLHSFWEPAELQLERYLIAAEPDATNAIIFDEKVFGEQLLVLDNQARTKQGKRADIIALDSNGNGVFIELKKRGARQGVETQALQYLANYSGLKGERFLKKFKDKRPAIDQFLQDYDPNIVNQRSRIILIARSFDSSLFSMGEWLASQGVAFRCIEYTPFKIGSQKFLSFSVRFDRSRDPIYQLAPDPAAAPQHFWHNIGWPSANDRSASHLNEWMRYLWQQGMLTASFKNEPNDQGESILSGYVKHDTVFAYASGYGAVGWGIVESPDYDLVNREQDMFSKSGLHLHRLRGVRWKNVAEGLDEAISPVELKEELGLAHPIQTKSRIRSDHAKALIAAMKNRFTGL